MKKKTKENKIKKETSFPNDYESHQRQSYDKPYKDSQLKTEGAGYEEFSGNGIRSDSDNEGRYKGKGTPSQDHKTQDEKILEHVHNALGEESLIDASEIEVVVENGNVTLQGMVFKERDKRLAEQCLKTVEGIQGIENNLQVVEA